MGVVLGPGSSITSFVVCTQYPQLEWYAVCRGPYHQESRGCVSSATSATGQWTERGVWLYSVVYGWLVLWPMFLYESLLVHTIAGMLCQVVRDMEVCVGHVVSSSGLSVPPPPPPEYG